MLLAALTVGVLALVAGRQVWARQAAEARPNVVLIVADDMRADSVWAMPALGRLAERGVTFSRFFVPTPFCCPSRATILSGLYARHHGVIANDPPKGGYPKFDDRSTVATWLSAIGVRTGLIGRYLNSYQSLVIPPGWDYWFAIMQANEDTGLYFRYYANHMGEDEFYGSSSEKYSTRVIGQRALKFLRDEPTRPFMLLLAPRAPHGPATPETRDAGSFKQAELPLPPSYDEADVSDKPSWIRDRNPLTPAERERLEGFRRRQLESLQSLDRMIDGVVEALRADGRLDRTWFIFTSDNGLVIGEHRLEHGKACPYEECVRVPLIVVPPGGLAAPRTDDRLVSNIDLAPTIAAIMGTEPATPVDGRSLLPLVRDAAGTMAWRDALVLEQWNDDSDARGFFGVRTADRKYVLHENGEDELYDVAADPYELENLAADPTRAEEKAALIARLAALVAE